MANDAVGSLRAGGTRARGLAHACSAASGVCLVLLVPVLGLFVDLLVWKGRMPSYGTLAPARQKQFRDGWNADASRKDEFRIVGASEAESWETKWETATVKWLRDTVGPEAADAYIHVAESYPGGYKRTHVLDETRLGLLPTVAREHGRWTGSLLGGVARVMPWLWRPGGDGHANDGALISLTVVGLLLTIGAGAGAMGARHYACRVAIDLGLRVRRAVYQHAFRIGSVALSAEERGHVAGLLGDSARDIAEAEDRTLRATARNPIVLIGAAAMLLLVNPLLGAALLAAGAALWLIVGQVVARFRRDAREGERAFAAADARLRESTQRFLLVKAYLMDRFAQNRVERQLDDLAAADLRIRRGHAFSRPFLLAVGSVAAVALLAVLGGIVLAGGLSVAGLAMLLAAGLLFVAAARSRIHHRVAQRVGQSATADVNEFLERRTDPGQSLDAEFLQPVAKRIEFHGVGVREPGTGTMLLDDVTASIPAGSRVAVVARDRGLLQSFARSLVRFVEPTAGEIKADGKNLRWVTTDSLRTQIAYVAEDSLTITDTVVNNIGCGDPGFGLPQVMEAAKVAHAHQFVQRLPYGYETMIGGPGSALTVGQQYRIALARAILRDPSVLVVEEPTMSIDADSAALVEDTIARIRPGRTIIQLAHREATLRAADTVLVLDQGRVVANGTHDALMKNNDDYRRLGYRSGE